MGCNNTKSCSTGVPKGNGSSQGEVGVSLAGAGAGGFREKGSPERTINRYYELWHRRRRKVFLSIENAQFFSSNTWQMMPFLNPLHGVIPKDPIFIFRQILGPGHLWAQGSI